MLAFGPECEGFPKAPQKVPSVKISRILDNLILIWWLWLLVLIETLFENHPIGDWCLELWAFFGGQTKSSNFSYDDDYNLMMLIIIIIMMITVESIVLMVILIMIIIVISCTRPVHLRFQILHQKSLKANRSTSCQSHNQREENMTMMVTISQPAKSHNEKWSLWWQFTGTRSLGALRAPTSSWRPVWPLDFLLRVFSTQEKLARQF